MKKNYLIIHPKNGLCNQLQSISKGIILGIISNRDIIFKCFQLDYKNFDNLCPFDTIIDIKNLQKKLNMKNINVNIDSNTEIKGIPIFIPENDINYSKDIADIKDFIKYLFIDKNTNIKYIDIGCPISCDIPYEYIDIYDYINLNIKFVDKYIDIANEIKEKLKLKYYCCVHLRLEDDSINFMKDQNKKLDFNTVNEIYKNKYIEELELLNNTKQKIYICTSLCMNENINNLFYKDIKSKYNLIDKNDIINVNQNNCREIYGIIDFIIAKDSLYFSGSDWSSFSIYIYINHKFNNKDAKLINIWNTLINI